jgi:hypothetical protein
MAMAFSRQVFAAKYEIAFLADRSINARSTLWRRSSTIGSPITALNPNTGDRARGTRHGAGCGIGCESRAGRHADRIRAGRMGRAWKDQQMAA